MRLSHVSSLRVSGVNLVTLNLANFSSQLLNLLREHAHAKTLRSQSGFPIDIFVILHFEKFISISICCASQLHQCQLHGKVFLFVFICEFNWIKYSTLLNSSFEGIMLNESTKVYGWIFFYISSFMCIFNICLHRSFFYFKGTNHNC